MKKKIIKKTINPKTKELIERETLIESQKQPQGCKIPLINGCLVPIIFLAFTIIAVKECKRSNIRLEQEKIKLEQMKDGTVTDKSPIINPDTLKIGNFQKVYIPLLKEFQYNR